MPYAVFSFRQEYSTHCSRGCNCLLSGDKSDFDFKYFENADQVINYLIQRYKQEPKAKYKNIIFDRFETLKNLDYYSHHSITSHFEESLEFIEDADDEDNAHKVSEGARIAFQVSQAIRKMENRLT